MYVLGLVGWSDRSHDAAACLAKNGQIVSAAEEERFVRRKHAYDSFPYNASKFCLEREGLKLDDVDYVAIGWDIPRQYSLRNATWDMSNSDLADRFFPRKYFQRSKVPRFEFVDHHLAHAASAYRCSGFDRSSILVVDGQGEHSSTSIWIGKGGKIKPLANFPIRDSLGYFYEALTQFCGFHSDDPGKLMGLAPYGKPVYDLNKFFNLTRYGLSANIPDLRLDSTSLDKQKEITELWFSMFGRICAKNESIYSYDPISSRFIEHVPLDDKYKDLAASGQKTLEDTMLHLARLTTDIAGSRNLCIAGGVALNCSANGKVVQSGLADQVFIQPAANDAGCSIGAALELSAQMGYTQNSRLRDAYLGPAYSEGEISDVLRSRRISFEYFDDIESKTAEIVSQGSVVGWYQGRMEIGPRALGNRSIIADPRYEKTRNFVNSRVKFRESFRPFAPSITNEESSNYIEGCRNSPFMLLSFQVKSEKSCYLGAVTHVDGSTRPQTVDKENERYHKLLKEMEKRIGVPAVLNTSFNRKGEALVCTPGDALDCFFGSRLDYLVMENLLVSKL